MLLGVAARPVSALVSAACPFADSETATECILSSAWSPGPGPFTFSKTLHVTATGSIDATVGGITLNVNGSPALNLIMDNGAVIESDEDGTTPGDAVSAASIAINVSGSVSMAAGSRISADNLEKLGAGGDIAITALGDMTMSGTAGSDRCRSFAGPHGAIYSYGEHNTPNVYGTPSLGARISAVRYGGSGSSSGGNISVVVGNYGVPPSGVFTMQRCALVDASSLGSAGEIEITAGRTGNLDGLVLSESAQSGTGNAQNSPRGGGPISARAGCELIVSDTGMVSSKGQDQGADLVHLEGCDVFIFGIVQSTAPGAGHALPRNNFAIDNRCNADPVAHPPGAAAGFTGCVEVWGRTITINAASHNGQVNVDGIRAPMRGWIDLFATLDVSITGDTPPGANPTGRFPHWAVEADACPTGSGGSPPCSNSFGGVVTIKAVSGKVTTSGQAILRANASAIGSDGGAVTIQAGGPAAGGAGNVGLDGSFIEALTALTSENTVGGTIWIQSFNATITSAAETTGHVDASGGATPGAVNLVACVATSYAGAVTPAETTLADNVGVCGGAPSLPANAVAALAFDAAIWAACPEGGEGGDTGPPEIPDTAAVPGFAGPLAALIFGLILLASLGTLAYANVRAARQRR